MDAETRHELARIRAEMEALITERTRNIPARFPSVSRYPYVICRVDGGNNILPAGYTGIKKIATTLATIATYDLSTDPATVNGIGWGLHSELNQRVLILNDSRSGVGHDLMINSSVFVARQPITISDQDCYVIVLV